MPVTRKTTGKTSTGTKPSAKKAPIERYFQGIGRRKLSVARVKIFVIAKEKKDKGEPEIIVNGKQYSEYFSLSELSDIVMSPLKSIALEKVSRVQILVHGGGIRGQAESARLGIARALVLMNPDFKKPLKDLGYLTRDARRVERKKAGLKKARRAPQFSKR